MILHIILCKDNIIYNRKQITGDLFASPVMFCVLVHNNPFHFHEGNRTEVVVVHTDIVLSREQHIQAREIQPGFGERTTVYMAEKLPYVPV